MTEGASSADVLDAGELVTERDAEMVRVEAGDEEEKDAVGDEEVSREAIGVDQTATVVCSALSTSVLDVALVIESPLSLFALESTEEESFEEESLEEKESSFFCAAASLAALLAHRSQYLPARRWRENAPLPTRNPLDRLLRRLDLLDLVRPFSQRVLVVVSSLYGCAIVVVVVEEGRRFREGERSHVE